MRYKIIGETLPAVTITCDAGERLYAQAGGMTWMSDDFDVDANLKGGLMKGLGRMLAGESLFFVNYTALRDGAEITFASTFPGNILAVELDGRRELICQKNAFLCATEGIETEIAFNGPKAGFFGGEGFIMQRISGCGLVFLELDGTVAEKTLLPGERIRVDTGNVAAFDATVRYTADMVKGLKNIVFGGEGLFLTVLEGPGRIYLQTMDVRGLAGRLLPYMPVKSN
ncbi:MAG: TIGR00266 family protein [Clostridia bacterium]|nr:TIGR00266 family protein [Clostridia bacterium]